MLIQLCVYMCMYVYKNLEVHLTRDMQYLYEGKYKNLLKYM